MLMKNYAYLLFRRLLTRDVRDVKRLYLSGERPFNFLFVLLGN